MNIAVTGPRPKSLGNCYSWKDKKRVKIRAYMTKQAEKLLEEYPDEEFNVYIGMAIGIDQDFFDVWWHIQDIYRDRVIRLIAVIPFRDQYKRWNENDKSRYFKFIKLSDDVEYVDELERTKYYSKPSTDSDAIKAKLKTRNRYLVDMLTDKNDRLFAYPTLDKNSSYGTRGCIRYANKNKKKIIITELEFKK